MEALVCLTNEQVKELIPKVGPRVKFMSKLSEYTALLHTPVVIDAGSESTTTNTEVRLLN